MISTFYDFKGMCRETWSERFNCLCIDMSKYKKEGKYRPSNESKNRYIGCWPETTSF